MKAYESGRIMAEFRGVTPTQRDELVETLGDRIATSESPWLSNLLVVFNTQQAAVRRCARAARAVAGDRPLGRGRAAAGLDLSQICRRADAARREPGDVGSRAGHVARFLARHRRVARRGEAAARRSRRQRLTLTLLVRDIPIPHYAGADLLAESWKEIGITVTQDRRNIWDWQKVVDSARFRHCARFLGRLLRRPDDPADQICLARSLAGQFRRAPPTAFSTRSLSAQAMTTDPRQRAKIVRDFERHALTEAYTVPLLWWNRIVATSAKLKGWNITPSHFIGQDLDRCLARHGDHAAHDCFS